MCIRDRVGAVTSINSSIHFPSPFGCQKATTRIYLVSYDSCNIVKLRPLKDGMLRLRHSGKVIRCVLVENVDSVIQYVKRLCPYNNDMWIPSVMSMTDICLPAARCIVFSDSVGRSSSVDGLKSIHPLRLHRLCDRCIHWGKWYYWTTSETFSP